MRSLVLRIVRSFRIAFSIGVLVAIAPPLNGQAKPADSVFEQSTFQSTYKIPPSFHATELLRGYFPTPVGNVPYRVQSWRNKIGAISVKVTVMPDVWWQTLSNQALAQARLDVANDPKARLLQERDYSISGCRAHSMVFDQQGEPDEFRRIDYLLVKPDLRVMMFVSSKEAALDSAACKGFFESISIKPKTP